MNLYHFYPHNQRIEVHMEFAIDPFKTCPLVHRAPILWPWGNGGSVAYSKPRQKG